MADKPSRGLVLYGDGLARFVDPSHSHLHSIASLGVCGFLSLPNSPPSESEEERIVREFALLLDACESYPNTSGENTTEGECLEKSPLKTIAERFMGARAALFTCNSSLKSFGGKLGLTSLQLNELLDVSCLKSEPSIVASKLLSVLGFEDDKVLETSQFDLVFVHVGADESMNGHEGTDYVNTLVGGLIYILQQRSEIASRLHLSVVMGYGMALNEDSSCLSFLNTNDGNSSNLSRIFPRQSYTMKGGHPRNNIRHYCAMLMVQWQNAVTRKDAVDEFSFQEFKKNGGNLTVPGDRFIHEVAFKLWKAPKYGA